MSRLDFDAFKSDDYDDSMIYRLISCRNEPAFVTFLADAYNHDKDVFIQILNSIYEKLSVKRLLIRPLIRLVTAILHQENYGALYEVMIGARGKTKLQFDYMPRVMSLALTGKNYYDYTLAKGGLSFFHKTNSSPTFSDSVKRDIRFWVRRLSHQVELKGLYLDVHRRLQSYIAKMAQKDVIELFDGFAEAYHDDYYFGEGEHGYSALILSELFWSHMPCLVNHCMMKWKDSQFCLLPDDNSQLDCIIRDVVFASYDEGRADEQQRYIGQLLQCSKMSTAGIYAVIDRVIDQAQFDVLLNIPASRLRDDDELFKRVTGPLIKAKRIDVLDKLLCRILSDSCGYIRLPVSSMYDCLIAIVNNGGLSNELFSRLFQTKEHGAKAYVSFAKALFHNFESSQLIDRVFKQAFDDGVPGQLRVKQLFDWLSNSIGHYRSDPRFCNDLGPFMSIVRLAMGCVDFDGELTERGRAFIACLSHEQIMTLCGWYDPQSSVILRHAVTSGRVGIALLIKSCLDKKDKKQLRQLIVNAYCDGVADLSAGLMAYLRDCDDCSTAMRVLLILYPTSIPVGFLDTLFERAADVKQVHCLLHGCSEFEAYFRRSIDSAASGNGGSKVTLQMFKYLLSDQRYCLYFFQQAYKARNFDCLAASCFEVMCDEERAQCLLSLYKQILNCSDGRDYDYAGFFNQCLETLILRPSSTLRRTLSVEIDGKPLLEQIVSCSAHHFSKWRRGLMNKPILFNYYEITGGAAMPASLRMHLFRHIDNLSASASDRFIMPVIASAITAGDNASVHALMTQYPTIINYECVWQTLDNSRFKARPNLLMLALGSKVNDTVLERLVALTPNLDAASIHGDTALHIAIRANKASLVNKMLKYSSVLLSLNQRNKSDKTVLSLAIEAKNQALVHALLEAGLADGLCYIDVDVRFGWNRQSLLHLAVETGDATVLQELLRYPALRGLLTCKTSQGETPLELARRIGHVEVIRLLEHPDALALVDASEERYRMRSLIDAGMTILGEQLRCHDHSCNNQMIRGSISEALQCLRELPLSDEVTVHSSIERILQALASKTYQLVEGGRMHSFMSTASRRAFEKLGYVFKDFPLSSGERIMRHAARSLAASWRSFNELLLPDAELNEVAEGLDSGSSQHNVVTAEAIPVAMPVHGCAVTADAPPGALTRAGYPGGVLPIAPVHVGIEKAQPSAPLIDEVKNAEADAAKQTIAVESASAAQAASAERLAAGGVFAVKEKVEPAPEDLPRPPTNIDYDAIRKQRAHDSDAEHQPIAVAL